MRASTRFVHDASASQLFLLFARVEFLQSTRWNSMCEIEYVK